MTPGGAVRGVPRLQHHTQRHIRRSLERDEPGYPRGDRPPLGDRDPKAQLVVEDGGIGVDGYLIDERVRSAAAESSEAPDEPATAMSQNAERHPTRCCQVHGVAVVGQYRSAQPQAWRWSDISDVKPDACTRALPRELRAQLGVGAIGGLQDGEFR
jgi:hypothetical protein